MSVLYCNNIISMSDNKQVRKYIASLIAKTFMSNLLLLPYQDNQNLHGDQVFQTKKIRMFLCLNILACLVELFFIEGCEGRQRGEV